jgi:hypothetical protein
VVHSDVPAPGSGMDGGHLAVRRGAVRLSGALPPPTRGKGNAVRPGTVRRPFHILGHLQHPEHRLCLRQMGSGGVPVALGSNPR